MPFRNPSQKRKKKVSDETKIQLKSNETRYWELILVRKCASLMHTTIIASKLYMETIFLYFSHVSHIILTPKSFLRAFRVPQIRIICPRADDKMSKLLVLLNSSFMNYCFLGSHYWGKPMQKSAGDGTSPQLIWRQ